MINFACGFWLFPSSGICWLFFFSIIFWQISKGARQTGNRNWTRIQTPCHRAAQFRGDVPILKPAFFLAEPTGIALPAHGGVDTAVFQISESRSCCTVSSGNVSNLSSYLGC